MINQYYENRCLLVTGGTGFLGLALIVKVLRDLPQVRKVYALLRTRRGSDGQVVCASERLQQEVFEGEAFASFRAADPEGFARARQKVVAVGGDISVPDLGIDPVQRQELLDEVDTIFKANGTGETQEMLRGVLDAGYRAGGFYVRMAGQGASMHAQRFDCFGPKALGGIGRLPGTLDDRSIIITLKRRIRSEPVRRLRMREAREEAAPMRDRLAAWGENAFPQLQEARPDSPDELDDRAQDSWDPLLAIADLAGEGWPQKARDAALALSAGIEPEDDSVGVRLLADLAFIFGTDDAKTTADLVTALNQMYAAPWPGFHKGAGIQARDLARLLRPFGVRPCNVRVGEVQSKGYNFMMNNFQDKSRTCLMDVKS